MHLQWEHDHTLISIIIGIREPSLRNWGSYKNSVLKQSYISWDMTPCSALKVNRKFGGTSRLRLDCYLFHAGFLLGLFFDTEEGCDMFLRIIHQLSTDYMVLYSIKSTLHNNRCENIRSYIILFLFSLLAQNICVTKLCPIVLHLS
jgi:hypothetical protein